MLIDFDVSLLHIDFARWLTGTYPAYCLPDGANATLPNLEQIFQDNNALDLFYEMQQFWVSDTTSDASFYAHEVSSVTRLDQHIEGEH
jgi:isochorismate hydrolase